MRENDKSNKKIDKISNGVRIIFVSPEVVPFAKTGGLADVSGALPAALAKLKCKVSVIMPFYQLVRKNGFSPKLFKNISFKLANKETDFNLLHLRREEIDFYFVDKKKFYDRKALYNTVRGDYKDNALRFGFFARAVLASISHIGRPDILHCNDWQSALTPLYLKLLHKDGSNTPKGTSIKNIKTIFTIHNMAYQGLFAKDAMPQLDLPKELFHKDKLEFYGRINFMKAGIIYSDAISTVSEGYRREILTEEFGCGLDGLLRRRQNDLYGILNGADYAVWNPETDKFICKNYTANNLKPKLECKKDLLKQFKIKFDQKLPLIGMVTRLAEQKGLDLVAETIGDMLQMGANFVCLGTGDEKYNQLFRNIARKYKGKVGIKVGFDNALAHKIEAGSDMFLMPSRYEPCGLNQMYSLKYATIPVVRATGGLDDTIQDFNPQTQKGNGFKFKAATKKAMLKALKTAIHTFQDKKSWHTLQKNGLKYNFSWQASARKYIKLYKKLLK